MTSVAPHSATLPNPHGEGKFLPPLDGWRALAALTVGLVHGVNHADLTHFHALQHLPKHGGALFFFSLSGYLITSRLYARSKGRRVLSLRDFYLKRAFRLMPGLLVFLAVLVLLQAYGVLQLERGDWAAPLFSANYFQGSPYTEHLWTLAVVEHFYLFWPLAILLAGWRRAMYLGIATMAAVAVWRPWALAHFLPSPTAPGYKELYGTWLTHTDLRIDYVMAGCVIALLLGFYPSLMTWARRLGSMPGLLCLCVALAVGNRIRHTPIDGRSIEAVTLALIVICSSLTDTPFSRYVLGNRFMLFMGKISYSFYLYQQVFFAQWQTPWLNSPWLLPVKLALSIGAGMLSFRYVEEPMIRIGQSFIKSKRGRATSPEFETADDILPAEPAPAT